MNYSTASVLGLVYVLSELGLAFKRRAKAEETRNEDRGSLALLWIVIAHFDVIEIARAGIGEREQAVEGDVHVISAATDSAWLR